MAKSWTNGTTTTSTNSGASGAEASLATITWTHHSAQVNGHGDRT